MSFGLFWLSSVVLSNFMFIVSILRGVKDIVEEGYRITFNKTNKADDLNNDNLLSSYLILLVPFLNILAMLSFSALIINDKGILFDMFKSENMLKKMTKEEIDEYSKKPTLLNAFKICIKSNEKISKNPIFRVSFENIDGIIEYTLENDDIKIINSTLDNNKYDFKTQKNLVKAALELFYQREIIKFKSEDELIKYYLSNNKLLNKVNDFKITAEDQEKIKIYFLKFEFLDKYNELLLDQEKIDNLEKEITTTENKDIASEKLELINKLKLEYKRLSREAIIIKKNISNYENIDKIENIKDQNETKYIKKYNNK